jgi:folate-binding protein YgfZ
LTQVALPQLAVARVRGADAAAFLHAQLSADIAGLEDGSAAFACYCSPRGQVYGLLLVCRSADVYLLVADAELLPTMIQRLRMFVLRAGVVLEMAPDLAAYGMSTDGAAGGGDFQAQQVGLRYRLSPAGHSSSEDPVAWKAGELARNVVWLSAATSERFIPQMLGLDGIGAISFSKGCYPGQEIIARARYLGNVKRKPLLLLAPMEVNPSPGASVRLLDGDQWLDSTVIDSAETPDDDTHRRLLFVVAPSPDQAIRELEFAGRSYRCATM